MPFSDPHQRLGDVVIPSRLDGLAATIPRRASLVFEARCAVLFVPDPINDRGEARAWRRRPFPTLSSRARLRAQLVLRTDVVLVSLPTTRRAPRRLTLATGASVSADGRREPRRRSGSASLFTPKSTTFDRASNFCNRRHRTLPAYFARQSFPACRPTAQWLERFPASRFCTPGRWATTVSWPRVGASWVPAGNGGGAASGGRRQRRESLD